MKLWVWDYLIAYFIVLRTLSKPGKKYKYSMSLFLCTFFSKRIGKQTCSRKLLRIRRLMRDSNKAAFDANRFRPQKVVIPSELNNKLERLVTKFDDIIRDDIEGCLLLRRITSLSTKYTPFLPFFFFFLLPHAETVWLF